MGRQYTRAPSPTSARAVQTSRHEMPRQGFEVDLFHRVSRTLDLAVDHGLQGCSRGIGKEPGCHLDLASQPGRSKLPLLEILYLLKGKVEIKMALFAQSSISRSRRCLRTRPDSGVVRQGLQKQGAGNENNGPHKAPSQGCQEHWKYSSIRASLEDLRGTLEMDLRALFSRSCAPESGPGSVRSRRYTSPWRATAWNFHHDEMDSSFRLRRHLKCQSQSF